MLINFADVKMLNIEGVELEAPLYKELANVMYQRSKDLGLVEHARAIYKGEEVDLSPAELKEVESVINGQINGEYIFSAVARKTLLDFISSKTK